MLTRSKDSWNNCVGMQRRLSRLFKDDGRSLVVAADHRQRGLQEGMENFDNVTSKLSSALYYGDALLTTKEPMRHLIASSPDHLKDTGLILSLNRTGLSGSVFEWDDRLVTSPETGLRWDVDCVKLMLRIDPYKPETSSQLEICGKICEECERWSLPLMLEPFYCTSVDGRLKIDVSAEKIRYVSIIASDFSVPVLKIPYPEGPTRSAKRRSFRDIVQSVNSKVLILGGRKGALTELLQKAEDSIAEGASGLVIGRNVVLDENPAFVACALSHIVHKEEDAETALKEAQEEAGGDHAE